MKQLFRFLIVCTFLFSTACASVEQFSTEPAAAPSSRPKRLPTDTPQPTPTTTPTQTPIPTATPNPGVISTQITSMEGAAYSPWSLLEYGLFVISPDGKHIAYVDFKGGKITVTKDNEVSDVFFDIPFNGLQFSPDSQHWCMMVLTSEDEVVVFADGKPGPVGDGYVFGMTPTYSPDSEHLYYGLLQDDKSIFVFDGQVGKPYDDIEVIGGFSSYAYYDHGHYAYIAQVGEQWMIVTDGKEGQFYDEIEDYSAEFSKDGQYNFVYEARRGDKWYLVTGNQESEAYDGILQGFMLTSDGQHTGYAVIDQGKQYIVTDGIRSDAYTEILDIDYDATASHTYYVARRDSKLFYIIDGTEIGPFKLPDEDGFEYFAVEFSIDGQHQFYVDYQENGTALVVDHQAGPVYDNILYPSFSDDGQHVIYNATKDGQSYVVYDQTEYGPFPRDSIKVKGISDDGQHVYIVYTDNYGLERMVVDGKEELGYQKIYLPYNKDIFSLDGLHYAFAAKKGEDSFVIVVDGKESRVFGGVYEVIVFSPDSSMVAYVGQETGSDTWQVYVQSLADGHAVPVGEAYDTVESLNFLPDNKLVFVAAYYQNCEDEGMFDRYAYPYQDGDEWFVVIEGKVETKYDTVLFFEDIAYEEPGRVVYLAFDDDIWYHISQIIGY